jgi:demethylmenaquinone methyltransferase/2-methoxy-6-polyprenyl-1,4-benzoquinol methylase
VSAAGTSPPGTSGERQAARWVQQMFAGIAPKYDLLNHLLSFNIDRRWRKRLQTRFAPVLERHGARVLDLCCGTGDVLFELQASASAQVFGADFCHPMLTAARKKAARNRVPAQLVECDALELPLAGDSADAISIAFGFRNLANYEAGLREFYRVLKPDGIVAILEFSHPRKRLVKNAYAVYSNFLLPVVGALISGAPQAYRYLPDSVRRFPRAEELSAMMKAAGFENTSFELLTGGIAALQTGCKSSSGRAR